APGRGTPTGTVDFFDTTTTTDLGMSPLASNGTASLKLGAGVLLPGNHSITATSQGDGNFMRSASSTSLRVVAPASLSGTVYDDFNNNGEIDFGEPGIAGVYMHLTGADDLGQAVDRLLATN